ncbi:hypothetical protein ACVU7I_03185 [Patulibacter sp. S7RM1-6]
MAFELFDAMRSRTHGMYIPTFTIEFGEAIERELELFAAASEALLTRHVVGSEAISATHRGDGSS